MNLLLDTHVAIWAVATPELLPRPILELVGDETNDVFVSAATLWEIAIKHPLRRRNAPPMPAAEARQDFLGAGFVMLAITDAHAAAVESLPLLHYDPFDRLIVAQAMVEHLRLITHDGTLAGYSDTIITF